MEEEVRQIIVCDEDIRESVAIVVREGNAHSPPYVPGNPSLFGNVFKCSIAIIVVKLIRNAFKILRMTVHSDVSTGITAVPIEFGCPLSVIHNEQIEQAVVIVIEPTRSNRNLVTYDTRLYPHI